VVVKGGVYIEKLAKVSAVLFDKTGTLTMGKPIVHQVKGTGEEEDRALLYAAALDKYSNHPIAQAIIRKSESKGLNYAALDVRDVEEVPGKGIIQKEEAAQFVGEVFDLCPVDRDLALLKISSDRTDFPNISLATAAGVQVGTDVMALDFRWAWNYPARRQ
jgi:magnesium-transporting ATPase (P-type)